MIELEEVWRTYRLGGEPIHALAGISERIEAGEHVAIMGPSGSGKSTLLHVLGCLDRPTAGSYRLDGQDVTQLEDDALAELRGHRIGFVFQAYHLVARLSAEANVELPMVFLGVPRGERRRRAAAALEAVGLLDRRRHRPAELSGGQRQRVAIARATVMRPRLLLADEPTGNLDSAAGAQVLDLLDQLHAEGITLVVVTHDPEVARRAGRVLVLRDGRVAARLAGSELGGLERALGRGKPGP
ncbi:MAG: putative ABC transporter ATP-binding protein [Planctomycetota bacterium]|nr:MAG: putative ABC transporter ATP-binding protein [Planctomycetota bacterium]